MGLSYTGSSCLLVTMVSGYSRVPEPPAKIIPFILSPLYSLFFSSSFKIDLTFAANTGSEKQVS
jgi:hypothetical protein